MSIQSPRGTRDILPDQQTVWQKVADTARDTVEKLGFKPISLPTYEELGLFQRSIGKGTDVMDKELFLVRGVRAEADSAQYALRPEGTAGMVRAYIQHGMQTWPQPVKLYSLVNLFRYDRPQKGRYREHVQLDLECFGDLGPYADAWVIFTTWNFFNRLGIGNLELRLNTLGTKEERDSYVQTLRAYFQPLYERLSQDSQQRLSTNPLRILDSKDEADQKLCRQAPGLIDFLSTESLNHFQTVQEYLRIWKIPFTVDSFLVRGLDYYCHTAFEWVIRNQEGQQDSLGGGGRYDGLLVQLDGPNVGGVGAGIGLDRVAEEMDKQKLTGKLPKLKTEVFLVCADPSAKQTVLELADRIFNLGISIDMNLSKEGISSQLKAASRAEAEFALIVGEQEINKQAAVLKNLRDSQQQELPFAQIPTLLKEALTVAHGK